MAENELVDLYAECLAVFYAPFDEDFGFVPYEAFLSEKPVVTTRDAGGPLEVVVDRENGLVCEPGSGGGCRSLLMARREPRPGPRLRPFRKADGRASHLGCGSRPSLGLLKVAYFSPLPPERSGIADYSALLLPALEKRLDVTVVRRGAKKSPRGTDLALYHIGNNPDAHGWIVDALRRRPGLVVLHDFVLHHLVAGLTLGRGDSEAYLDAMQRDAGVVGRLLAHGVVDHLLPPIWEERAEDFPLASEVLDRADGVICHSRYVERQARAYGYEGPIWVVPMPAWPSVELGGRLAPEGRFPIVACVGHLNAAKRIPAAPRGIPSAFVGASRTRCSCWAAAPRTGYGSTPT